MSEELIARLERAEGPDRELDLAIADHALDLEWRPYIAGARKLWGYKRGTKNVVLYDKKSVERYTASLDAALTLVGDEHNLIELRHVSPTCWYASVGSRLDDSVCCEGEATTGSLALCIACLKARALREKEQ